MNGDCCCFAEDVDVDVDDDDEWVLPLLMLLE